MAKALTRKIIAVDIVLQGATFGEGGNTKTIEGLACDVTIQKCGLPAKNSCVIEINNLKQVDIERITTLSPVKLNMERNIVKVRAWPEDQGPSEVYAGEIFLAYGTYRSPDLGVHIEAQTGTYPSLIVSKPFTFEGAISWEKIIRSSVDEMEGYTFCNKGVPDECLRDPVINGSPMEKIMDVARQLNFQVICDDMQIITMPWDKGMGSAIKVNATTGMIGYPELNPNGIRLKHEYRPYFRQGGLIQVESIVPGASGNWKILKLTHRLQSFGAGDAWDTAIEGIRINA